jgi:hypothetical protein
VHAVPACRADTLQRYLFVRPRPDGVYITMGLYTDAPCSLPTRPAVSIVIAGRPAAVERTRLPLVPTDVPRRELRPREPVTAVVRWRNWCGERGPVRLRLSLGGVTVAEELGTATTEGAPCVDPARPSTLAVSIFVRR